MNYKVIDLFAGAGGLSWGFSQTGHFSIVAAAENNADARKTYKRNHKLTRLYSDVRTIDYNEIKSSCGEIDVVIGGPPCQGFSNANRQQSTIISMNNRLVKEYVRSICELTPKAFVMENVAMLRSNVHRFIVEMEDLNNPIVMGLDLSEDKLELLPSNINFPDAITFAQNNDNINKFTWDEKLYKAINVLYRFRINHTKFNSSITRYQKYLSSALPKIVSAENEDSLTPLEDAEKKMAESLIKYMNEPSIPFEQVIQTIETPLFIQRMLGKMKELVDNRINVIDYRNNNGTIVAVVQSYAVFDYVKGILEAEPYNYAITPMVLNALSYGAPQRRERFIIVGVADGITYTPPIPEFLEGEYRTVRDAIFDLQDIPTSTDIDAEPIPLDSVTEISPLGLELRGKLLYNHVSTATRETAQARFDALCEGQNFHDLDNTLKTTYSNADRTQNTIYMRLRYGEPSGTVVNVRKSMWVHPELNRAISIREAARLQTFPDIFIFEGSKDSQYQQVGNAVPPVLAKSIATSIINSLESFNDYI